MYRFFALMFYFILFSTTTSLFSIDKVEKQIIDGYEVEFYSNLAIVTFQPELNYFQIQDFAKEYKFEIKEQLLLWKQTIMYQKSQNNTIMSDYIENNLSNIYDLERKLMNTYVISFETKNTSLFINKLKLNKKNILYAERYQLPKLLYKPNDPKINNQQHLNQIKVFNFWDDNKGNSDIIIGISDSGVDQGHEDIKDNLALNTNEIPGDLIDNDNNGYIDDYNGYNFAFLYDGVNPSSTSNSNLSHGQQVAGLAGASTDNNLGIAGVGFNSQLFPLKVVEGSRLKYAYQSILYAAVRGIKVLNMSWGSVKRPEDIDKLIIRYAIARDVALVTAAGNTGGGANSYSTFYPAHYHGVLGVGEINLNGMVTNETVYGAGTRIMAPGEGSYTLGYNNSYKICDGGSSFSTPIVAGAVALVRSKYPQLDAIQSIEFVRQCADTFMTQSSKYYPLTPGKLNMEKALFIDPFSIPAILHYDVKFYDKFNNINERFIQNEINKLKIQCKNHLGAANNLRFVLSIAYDPTNSIQIIQNNINKNSVEAGEVFDIEGFEFIMINNNLRETIMRVDIYADNDYHDFFKFIIKPTKNISTFANDSFFVSISDNGEIGFNSENDIYGKGLGTIKDGNQIYLNSTLMVTESPSSNIHNVLYNDTEIYRFEFSTAKGFVEPDRNIAIINDDKYYDTHLGLEITQKVEFESSKSKSARIRLNIKNTSLNILKNVALGYFLDWDVGFNRSKNNVRLLEDIYNDITLNSYASEYVFYDENFPYFGSGAYSTFGNVEAQAAGFGLNTLNEFNKYVRFKTLNSGTSMQYPETDDIGSVVGIKFNGDFNPNETRECVICFASGDNLEEFKKEMKNCLIGYSSISNNKDLNDFVVYPIPSDNYINIISNQLDNRNDIIIYNIFGQIMNHKYIDSPNTSINIEEFPAGIYYIKIGNNIKKFIKI